MIFNFFLKSNFKISRRIASKKTDKRINFLNEIFSGIKIIKMYVWEQPFKKIVETLRKYEFKKFS